MKKKLIFVLLSLLVAASTVCGASPADFTFTDLNGKTYTAADLKGTPLVINIGSHW
ncbi:MAG: hypothetical protein KKA70_13870 [Proteobacteria bacterium]|nr:hypothetical protein [Pseudomonadota bacterium]